MAAQSNGTKKWSSSCGVETNTGEDNHLSSYSPTWKLPEAPALSSCGTSLQHVPATGPGYEVQKHHHTKRGVDFWLVVMADRVDRDRFEVLRDSCKAAGGWYSRQWASTPGGFGFDSEAAATAWAFATFGEANPGPDGERPDLDCDADCSRRSHPMAECDCSRAEGQDGDRPERAGKPFDTETTEQGTVIRLPNLRGLYYDHPNFPATEREAQDPIAAKFRGRADRLQKDIDRGRADRLTNTPTRACFAARARAGADHAERTQTVLRALADLREERPGRHGLENVKDWRLIHKATQKRVDASCGYYEYREVGWYDEGEQSNAIRGLLDAAMTQAQDKARELARLEQNATFSNIPGFFPTPRPVIDRMLDLAGIKEGMSVLEPSAGAGAIVDVLWERFDALDIQCYEINQTLRDLLLAKGCDDCRGDFLEASPGKLSVGGVFDRVLMNPPFEQGQDIEHVMHAHRFLAPGGRLVAVMSAGVKSNRSAWDFRLWLDAMGGTMEDLPEGSFKASGTGVAAVLVVIDKD